MDPLSQGLLGATAALSFAKRDNLKTAAICGALGGMAPDLDILIRSASDPLLFVEFHRHFTHSLAFIPIGGLLVALFLYGLFFRNTTPFKRVYLFTTLGYATHGLLDACTSYGTRLLWPFSDERTSWNIVSIIDPIFTATLLIFVILCLIRKSPKLMHIGAALAISYLCVGNLKHLQAQNIIYQIAADRGHTIERILLNPTIGNHILWRSVYQANGFYYIDAVYIPYFSEAIIQEGEIVETINRQLVFPELEQDSIQRADIERFAYFSQGYIYIHPDDPYMIADLRYGTLPYDNRSLWGIKIDPKEPNQHVAFHNLRNLEEKHYDEFWLMLKGIFPHR